MNKSSGRIHPLVTYILVGVDCGVGPLLPSAESVPFSDGGASTMASIKQDIPA